jgi:hypothetical protein
MAKNREYIASISNFNKPIVYEGKRAIGMLLTRLIMLEPGSDPLHPDMGVGITSYRYTMNTLDELRARVKKQIETYLPTFNSSNVTLVITPDHLCNIEITIDDTVYVYNSNEATKKITIDDAK